MGGKFLTAISNAGMEAWAASRPAREKSKAVFLKI